jgi:hypothetical protein
MTPSKIKARGESQRKECLEKHKNIPHTCTSRSSCLTSFFVDPVFGSTISCGTSESLLSYLKLHIQAIEVGSWGSLKAFGEVTNSAWAIEGTIRGSLSFFAKFSKKTPRLDPEKKKSERGKVKTHSAFQPPKARWKATSPTGKCNTTCFCSMLSSANDFLNLSPNHPWSTPSQNPSLKP